MEISISGPGIVSVNSEELVKTPEAQRQIKAAHGLDKSLRKQVSEIESLRATISRLRVYAEHTTGCDSWAWPGGMKKPHAKCDCGYDALMAEVEDGK